MQAQLKIKDDAIAKLNLNLGAVTSLEARIVSLTETIKQKDLAILELQGKKGQEALLIAERDATIKQLSDQIIALKEEIRVTGLKDAGLLAQIGELQILIRNKDAEIAKFSKEVENIKL